MTLAEDAKNAIMKYDNKAAVEVAKKAVAENADLVDLIENGYSAGMTEVGALFEAKKLYLPHVMAAAATMNAAMEILEPEIAKKGEGDRKSVV